MMSDAWSGLLRKYVEFLLGRAERLLATSMASPEAMVEALRSGAQTVHQPALAALKSAVAASAPTSAETIAMVTRINDDRAKGQAALAKIQAALAAPGFTMSRAKNATTGIVDLVTAVDDAVKAVAEHVGGGNTSVSDSVHAIVEPWTRALDDVGGGALAAFNSVASTVLRVQGASGKLRENVKLDVANGRLKMQLVGVDGGALGPLSFSGAVFEAFIQFQDTPRIGLALAARIKAGLRSDEMMKRIIPEQAPTADADNFAVQLDSAEGLTFGQGKDRRIVLPVSFGVAGVELRELALSRPVDTDEDSARIDLTAVVAGKLGSALAVVSEGAGTSFISSAGGSFDPFPKLADGIGVRLRAGPLTGGGYLRRDPTKNEYGGVFELAFGPIGLTAIALFDPDSAALLVIIGFRFQPHLQLGFGFTLNGVGGLLASNRTIAIDPLSRMLSDGSVSNILMPDDPVASAPTILNQLTEIFPEQAGAFVVGPMVELGWGGVNFVRAKVGVLIALPDPTVVILGSLQVQVPSAEVKDTPRAIDLNVDLFAVLRPDEFFLKAALRKSTITGIPISGEMGLLIRWAGEADFAISAGGFFPNYRAPPKLMGLKRLAIQVSPPVKWIKLDVTGYVAVTSNTVQFGGALNLSAKVGPVKGEAHFSLDALFVWAPRFAFVVEVRASVSITFKGHSIAGASFRGSLSGTAPWRLQGSASVSILWWDVDLDVGPIEWGERDTAVLPLVDTMDDLRKAFEDITSWRSLAPSLIDTVTTVRTGDDMPPLLLQPFSLIEARQTLAPLETAIARIGPYASTMKQVTMANPRVGDQPASAWAKVQDPFAMGQYLNLTTDQQVARPSFEKCPSGLQMSPTEGALIGPAIPAIIEWDTFFPQSDRPKQLMAWSLAGQAGAGMLSAKIKARARAAKANPYGPINPGPLQMADPGLKQVLPMAIGSQAVGAAAFTTVAADVVSAQAKAAGQAVQQVTMGLAA